MSSAESRKDHAEAVAEWQAFVRAAMAELGVGDRVFAAALGHRHHSRVQSWREGRSAPWRGRRAGIEAQILALLRSKKSA